MAPWTARNEVGPAAFMNIRHYLDIHRQRVERVLRHQLRAASVPERRLREAMHYGVLNGGKRLRPVLAYASAQALGGHAGSADIPACALELVHS